MRQIHEVLQSVGSWPDYSMQWIDDTVLMTSSLKELYDILERYLKRIRQLNLRLNVDKCKLLGLSADFCGRTLDGEGYRYDDSYAEELLSRADPQYAHELAQFIYTANFLCSILPGFSRLRHIITKKCNIAGKIKTLERKMIKITWSSEMRNAFEELKEELKKSLKRTLGYYNHLIPTYIFCDASDLYWSHIIAQTEEEVNTADPYSSQYKVIAMKSGTFKGSSLKLGRWAADFMKMNLQVFHLPGYRNIPPDIISRWMNPDAGKAVQSGKIMKVTTRAEEEYCRLVDSFHVSGRHPSCIAPAAASWGVMDDLFILKIQQRDDGNLKEVLREGGKVVVTRSMIPYALVHTHSIFNHGAKKKEIEFIRKQYVVQKGLKDLFLKTIVRFRRQCMHCQRRSLILRRPLSVTEFGDEARKVIYCDFLYINKSGWILTMIDIVEIVSPSLYKVKDLEGKTKVRHASLLIPFAPSSFLPSADIRAVYILDHDRLEVDEIADMRRTNEGEFQFKIRWRGFAEDRDIWEAASVMFEDIPMEVVKFLNATGLDLKVEIVEFLKLLFPDSSYWQNVRVTQICKSEADWLAELKKKLVDDLVIIRADGKLIQRNWSVYEFEILKWCVRVYGMGSFEKFRIHLPSKNKQQLYNNLQRYLLKQALEEYHGLRLTLEVVRKENLRHFGHHLLEFRKHLTDFLEAILDRKRIIDECKTEAYYLETMKPRFPRVVMDPPYKIFSTDPVRGPQISYSVMPDDDIINLDLRRLGTGVVYFIWTLPSKKNVTLDMMRRNGIQYLGRFLWIKSTSRGKIVSSQGLVTGTCSEECLIGLVGNFPGKLKTRFFGKEILFGLRVGNSCKPLEFYERVDGICEAGVEKLELFGRNNNMRKGWTTVGDEVML
eukprot:augustus_masked-scaffold_8-processed-gene-14.99-mRNA-1 protein AED:1.00 eAED:1.00 QI:0/0/0/0/1/1/5/0/886